MSTSINIPPLGKTDKQRCTAHLWVVQCIRQTTTTFIAVIMALLLILKGPEPYHTSILSRQGWVNELLNGYPEHTHCELGTTWEVFLELVFVLCSLGHGDSKYIQLEEQLAIFLYRSITGLNLTHWQAFSMLKWNYLKILMSYAQNLLIWTFYTTYVKLPDTDTPPSQRIHSNLKLWPFFQYALSALEGSHIVCAPSSHSHPPYRHQSSIVCWWYMPSLPYGETLRPASNYLHSYGVLVAQGRARLIANNPPNPATILSAGHECWWQFVCLA